MSTTPESAPAADGESAPRLRAAFSHRASASPSEGDQSAPAGAAIDVADPATPPTEGAPAEPGPPRTAAPAEASASWPRAPDFRPIMAYFAASGGMVAANAKIANAINASAAENLKLVRALSQASSLPELMSLQVQQIAAAARQTAALGALARQAFVEAARPMAEAVSLRPDDGRRRPTGR